MKAQVWRGRKDVRYEEVPDPFPARDGWVVIKVKWAGICGSDLHEYTDGPIFIPTKTHPLSGKCGSLIQGHEFSGEVVSFGKGVTKFKLGDRITSDSCIKCDNCYWCLNKQYNLCEKVAFTGEMDDGAFAEYVTIPEYSCYHLPEGLTYEIGATVEPVSVTVHGIQRINLQKGENVGVVGCGPIGLIAIQVVKALEASKVFAFELIESRKKMAERMGADFIIDPSNEKEMELVRSETNGIGPDVIVECVGSEKATIFAINKVRRGGRVSIIGIAQRPYTFHFNDIVFNEVAVFGSSATTGGFPMALKLLSEGKVKTEPLITGKIKLIDLVTKGYEELLRNPTENFKILVTPDENLIN